jgi:hypothetical protein
MFDGACCFRPVIECGSSAIKKKNLVIQAGLQGLSSSNAAELKAADVPHCRRPPRTRSLRRGRPPAAELMCYRPASEAQSLGRDRPPATEQMCRRPRALHGPAAASSDRPPSWQRRVPGERGSCSACFRDDDPSAVPPAYQPLFRVVPVPRLGTKFPEQGTPRRSAFRGIPRRRCFRAGRRQCWRRWPLLAATKAGRYFIHRLGGRYFIYRPPPGTCEPFSPQTTAEIKQGRPRTRGR